ncbi:hypothetical protein [Pantoea dispersa]|uniref:hypothetical protein n=1 Tax=Pantoea dispersa TaxID=59814 RepID=UPI0024AF6B96|nr:hypothetical protein [Pantoea dispersa]MDI6635357.1 hypothetical protein [Pantoea dispersa]
MQSNNGGFISYISKANLNKAANLKPEKKPRGRPAKRKSESELPEQVAQSNELQILKVYSEPEKLSDIEQQTISEIVSSCPGVYHKPRPVMKIIIHAPERWQMIHASEIEFKFWCIYNRLENPMYDGYNVDILNMTSSGEGV